MSDTLPTLRRKVRRSINRIRMISRIIAGSSNKNDLDLLQRVGLGILASGSSTNEIVENLSSLSLGMDRRVRSASGSGSTSSRGIVHAGIDGFGSSSYNWLANQFKKPATRFSSYHDYDLMDSECVELGRALDIIATNVLAADRDDKSVITVKSSNPTHQRILDEVKERTELDEVSWSHCRETKKYGDQFLEIVYDKNGIIHRLVPLSVYSMHRIENYSGVLTGYEQRDSVGEVVASFMPWEIIHFRNDPLSGHRYGRSQLWRSRKDFRRLGMLDDASTIMVLTRAAQRLVHKVPVRDVGPQAEEDLDDYMARNQRRQSWDSSRASFNMEYNPLDDADVYLPTNREFPDASVTTLDGQVNYDKVLAILHYFEDRLFMVGGVPKAYFGREADVNSRATLMFQEMEFSRNLRRTQRFMADMYKKQLFWLQLQMVIGQNIPLDSFKVVFPKISKSDERMRSEIKKIDAETASILGSTFKVPLDAILVHFLGWDPKDAEDLSVEVNIPTTESIGSSSRIQNKSLEAVRSRVIESRRLREMLETLSEIGPAVLKNRFPVTA